jgi:hypothetical protein
MKELVGFEFLAGDAKSMETTSNCQKKRGCMMQT